MYFEYICSTFARCLLDRVNGVLHIILCIKFPREVFNSFIDGKWSQIICGDFEISDRFLVRPEAIAFGADLRFTADVLFIYSF